MFSGVGKTESEIEAALEAGIALLQRRVGGRSSQRIDAVAAALARTRAPVSLRVNPDVDAGTHPYISTGLKNNKFGVAYADALTLIAGPRRCRRSQLVGIDCHIGSQITELAPYLDAADRMLDLVEPLESRRHRAARTSTSAAASASATATRRRRCRGLDRALCWRGSTRAAVATRR